MALAAPGFVPASVVVYKPWLISALLLRHWFGFWVCVLLVLLLYTLFVYTFSQMHYTTVRVHCFYLLPFVMPVLILFCCSCICFIFHDRHLYCYTPFWLLFWKVPHKEISIFIILPQNCNNNKKCWIFKKISFFNFIFHDFALTVAVHILKHV